MGRQAVIITGAAGFLGSHLCARYLSAGYSVLGIDNFSSSSEDSLNQFRGDENFHFFHQNGCDDWSQLEKLIGSSGYDIKYIYHFASIATPIRFEDSFQKIFEANTVGLQRALEFSQQVDARVFFASSSEVYGRAQAESLREAELGTVNTLGPRSIYDESKRAGEALLWSWNQYHQTRHSIFRIFNTYGPGMDSRDGRVIVEFLSKIKGRQPIHIFGDGKQTRSFCFISDLIHQIFELSQKAFTVVNVGSDEEVTIEELVHEMKKVTGSSIKVINNPSRPEDPQKRKPNLERMRSLLGHQNRKSLSEGLKIYWSFLNQTGGSK
ncbi:MAG: NAD-dependent epimerase/dehydratase family protein [Proteobacteria bacterium]|jgi:dTDP-glucose 4,6-dehydratase|nr:NAD-dependent epimerase/dehydratase family protein [Pseudomonadota bacterium]